MVKVRKVIKIVIILLLIAVFIKAGVLITKNSSDMSITSDCIAILDINGTIIESDPIIEKFEELEKNNYVKGYILKVNSPGGLVTPSQEIYQYLKTVAKPMYVAMGSTAASGGYMVSLPADKIYAMPSTITGSIGVIMHVPNYEGLFNKIGIKETVIKSGKFKDSGSPSRPMSEEEKSVLNSVVMDMYEQFVNVVAENRNLTVAMAKELADGRIYTGQMAKNNGLVDELGSWQDAFDAMKEDFNLVDIEYKEITDENKTFLEKMLSETYLSDILSISQPSGFYFILRY